MAYKLTKSIGKATYIMMASVLLSLVVGNMIGDKSMGLIISFSMVNTVLFYLEEVNKERDYKYQLENNKLDKELHELDIELAKLNGWEEGILGVVDMFLM